MGAHPAEAITVHLDVARATAGFLAGAAAIAGGAATGLFGGLLEAQGQQQLALALLIVGAMTIVAGKLTTMLSFEPGAVRVYFKRWPLGALLSIRLEEHLPHSRLDGRRIPDDGFCRLLVTIHPVHPEYQPTAFSVRIPAEDADAFAAKLGAFYGSKLTDARSAGPLELTAFQADIMWLRRNVIGVYGLLVFAAAVLNL